MARRRKRSLGSKLRSRVRREAKKGLRRARGPLALLAAAVVALAVYAPGALSLPLQGLSGALSSQAASVRQAVSSQQAADGRLSAPTDWDADAYPDYYRVVGPAVVDSEPAAGEATYTGCDALGRAGRVVATVTYSMMEEGSAREREDMSALSPAGWGNNAQVTIAMPGTKDYHGYLFNRSHLLAKSLGGDDALYNLVTGTRTQNVGDNQGSDGGMAYTEDLARTWLAAHPEGTVYYSATPLYVGSELLCRSVVVDIRTSDGSIDQEVEVYNAARGFVIDYATGTFEEE